MAEEPKKISFGFTKINKKSVISLQKKEENQIQFIECLEGNSIKLLNGKEKEKELPIIPLRNGNVLRDNMIEALKARKEKKLTVESENNEIVTGESSRTQEETKPLTLDELAAKEILEDLTKVKETEEIQEVLTIPQVEAVKVSEKESTLDDYESMPVNQFGLAVLRGMGWAPEKGIGKTAQIVKPINPVLRPKGMGLGADKVIPVPKTQSKEELAMKKGASLKVISGLNKGLYGKVEGFDELPGRIMVRLTLQNIVISISENLVELVTSVEYSKNSKILNLKEYSSFVDNNRGETSEFIKTTENKSVANSHKKNRDEFSSEDEKYYKKEYKNVECYKSKDKKTSNYQSNEKYRKHKYTRNNSSSSDSSDSGRQIMYRHDSHSSRQSRNKETRIKTLLSDTDSSIDKKKSKSKKRHKHNSSHRTRSRSRSSTRKKKKKRNRHRSRS